MNYNEIVAISKLSGLFHIHKKREDGLIVKSLTEDKAFFAASRSHVFTPLENITIYTNDEPIELIDVLISMKGSKETMPEAKASNDDLKKYFGKIVKNFDQEKVYVSDIQKMIKWYSLLNANDLIKKVEHTEDTTETAEVKVEAKKVEKKTAIVKEKKTAAAPKSKSMANNKPVNRKTGG